MAAAAKAAAAAPVPPPCEALPWEADAKDAEARDGRAGGGSGPIRGLIGGLWSAVRGSGDAASDGSDSAGSAGGLAEKPPTVRDSSANGSADSSGP